ncbi:Leucine-Rich Repeat Lgi Family Member 4 [Manis pentadactyla]|nr:Leucine-Rich Repeat Lgi Family Member 4 [Manis pentadactyla]
MGLLFSEVVSDKCYSVNSQDGKKQATLLLGEANRSLKGLLWQASELFPTPSPTVHLHLYAQETTYTLKQRRQLNSGDHASCQQEQTSGFKLCSTCG